MVEAWPGVKPRSRKSTGMLAIPSLFAAMTIAGAFWVGVLAARRLRDLGDGDRALAEGDRPLALPSHDGGPSRDAAVARVRARVAERLDSGLRTPGALGSTREHEDDLAIDDVRVGDVATIEGTASHAEGDYIVEGLVRMREGGRTSVLLVLGDGGRARWLIGGAELAEWIVVAPVTRHGLAGEPPRRVELGGSSYHLRRRGQATAAALGRHERPGSGRVSTYVYESGAERVAWIERWGDTVYAGTGVEIAARSVSFLPSA
jgi:hypothetical protein